MTQDIEKSGNILIGEGVTMTGSLSVPGKATINGWLKGELEADELVVGPEGNVVGKVVVRIADIHGSTHDSIEAKEHLIIRSTGQVHGSATYGKIEIARGGTIVGQVSPTELRGVSEAVRASAKPLDGKPELTHLPELSRLLGSE